MIRVPARGGPCDLTQIETINRRAGWTYPPALPIWEGVACVRVGANVHGKATFVSGGISFSLLGETGEGFVFERDRCKERNRYDWQIYSA
jgi:hypothetical protein